MRGLTMRVKMISQEQFRKRLAEKENHLAITEKAQDVHRQFLPPGIKVVKTPKEILFPSWKEMYRFFFKERSWEIQEVEEKAFSDPTFLLLLPCEARAVVEVLDTNFLREDYRDTDYARRRARLNLVILGCPAQHPTCFCHLVGGSPVWRDGKSTFVLPWKEQFYVENDEKLFGEGYPVSTEEEREIESWEKALLEKLPSPLSPDFPEKLYAHFEDPEWQDIAFRCINCGACTFLCPTCYCFDLTVDGKLRGSMLRTWDSCMFPKFTLHASSHNPRPTGKERVRQRVMHKFSYFPLREKHYGCVGCGICREICPVNWDIKEAVERMVKRIDSRCDIN
jgi:sulfhydrogenase subunit beta (sulfur reductase)